MEFLYWLESIRTPIVNWFMLLITQLGDETAFLVVALIVFWCVDKYRGYYILSVGLLGTVANQFMKLWFRIPRPWVRDPNFQALPEALEGAGGYSFPSGHTQNSVGTFGGLAYTTKNKVIKALCIAAAILVPFSRMYVGVHTPADVLVAAAMAVVLIIVVHPFVLGKYRKYFPVLLGVMLMVSAGYLCFVELYPFPADIDAHNLASGTQNAYTLIGALLALLVVYAVDKKWLNFSTKAVWWAQILKVVIGLLLVLAIKSGLKSPLNAMLGESIGRAVRYGLIVLMAGIVWPLSFKWFSKLGTKE